MVFHTSQSAQDVVNVVITGRVWYIATILLLYVYCLTFSDENRYWPIACTVFDEVVLNVSQTSDVGVCHFFFQWASYSTIPVSITLGVILISKLHAMYGCNRKLLAVMCGFFVFDIVVTAAVGGTATHKMRAITVAGHTGCLPVNDYSYAWAYWVPSLGFEIILFVLALWKAVQEVRGDIRTPRLMVVLLRDSIFYFGAACTILLTNFFVWLFRPTLLGAFVPLVTAGRSIIGCRMLLNIQEVAETLANPPSSVALLPSIQFQTFSVMEEEIIEEISYAESSDV